jgi:hypothetical protein
VADTITRSRRNDLQPWLTAQEAGTHANDRSGEWDRVAREGLSFITAPAGRLLTDSPALFQKSVSTAGRSSASTTLPKPSSQALQGEVADSGVLDQVVTPPHGWKASTDAILTMEPAPRARSREVRHGSTGSGQ